MTIAATEMIVHENQTAKVMAVSAEAFVVRFSFFPIITW